MSTDTSAAEAAEAGTVPASATAGRHGRLDSSADLYAVAVHHRQRAYLGDLAWRAFPLRRPIQHDVACGPGRAMRLLRGHVRTAHGYDTSPAMLEQARKNNPRAMLHDLLEAGQLPQPATAETPAIVTAFRLLLEMDPGARDRTVAFAARTLPHYGSGLFILESQRHGQDHGHGQDVLRLLDRHGFAVVERRGFTLLSQGWYARRWLRPFARLADGVACRIPGLTRYARIMLYVTRRVHPGMAGPLAPANAHDVAR